MLPIWKEHRWQLLAKTANLASNKVNRPAVASCRGTQSTGRCSQRYNMRPGESSPHVPSTVVGSALSCLLSLQSKLCGQATEASGTAGNRTQQKLCDSAKLDAPSPVWGSPSQKGNSATRKGTHRNNRTYRRAMCSTTELTGDKLEKQRDSF